MKKHRTEFLIFAILLSFFNITLTGCNSVANYNNTASAEEIVCNIYEDEMISNLVDTKSSCRFGTIEELSECFEIECIRNPQDYEHSYMPYVVLLFENGSRGFVFFDYESHEILECLIIDEFMDSDSMGERLEGLRQSKTPYDEWYKLDKYNTGCSNGSVMSGRCVVTSDGIYVVVLGNGYFPQVQCIDYLSDDYLFSGYYSDDRIDCDLYTVWPILSIDKK